MLSDSQAFSGFSVDDVSRAMDFYSQVLGLEVEEGGPGFTLKLTGGTNILVYGKPDHQPAAFTVLNFPVKDIDATADKLIAAGVSFEKYDMGDMELDERGIFHSDNPDLGPSIAWFKDPAGNVLSILEI